MVAVPCGSCHLCCRMMTPLLPERGDDPRQYRTGVWLKPGDPTHKPTLVLERQPNGDCVYLDPASGCTIHDRAPWNCREYDCRRMFRQSDRAGRRLAVKRGEVDAAIFARGRELLEAERGR